MSLLIKTSIFKKHWYTSIYKHAFRKKLVASIFQTTYIYKSLDTSVFYMIYF